MALPDEELERCCKRFWKEQVIEVVASGEREATVLKSELWEEVIHREVRSFFKEVVQGFHDQDIFLLATARWRERTEGKGGAHEGHARTPVAKHSLGEGVSRRQVFFSSKRRAGAITPRPFAVQVSSFFTSRD
jgi:hypothetical protein